MKSTKQEFVNRQPNFRLRIKFALKVTLSLTLGILWIAGCSRLRPSNHEQIRIRGFATVLADAIDEVPENWIAQYYHTNSAIDQVRLLVVNNQSLILNMVTNQSEPWYSSHAQFAFILAGDAASSAIVPLAELLSDRNYAATVAGILPFLGTNGMAGLATGLNSQDEYVRRICAVSFTWPLHPWPQDDLFRNNYIKRIHPYLGDLTRVLRDPDPRVARAAAKSLGFDGANESIVQALEAAVQSTDIEVSVREAARKSLDRLNFNRVLR